MVVLYQDHLAGKTDHTLDEIVTSSGADPNGLEHGPDHSLGYRLLDLGLGRVSEHHDVAALGFAPVVGQLVDHDAVVDLDGREHRLRRDPERLDQERLNDDSNDQGGQEETGQLSPE